MTDDVKELWRREGHHFVIEIKVGNVWVEHCRANTEEEALFQGEKALGDPSILAVRVLEHNISHICTSLWEKQAEVVMRVPPKMTDTGRKQSCPGCYNPAPVADDGTTEWVFCAKCDRAFPV